MGVHFEPKRNNSNKLSTDVRLRFASDPFKQAVLGHTFSSINNCILKHEFKKVRNFTVAQTVPEIFSFKVSIYSRVFGCHACRLYIDTLFKLFFLSFRN